ncbi:inovirus Gp2 family protein [Brenneria populi subsp. brevivirga]|uniref:inovirus Gp2 family protein n=1 Tax=Brenneria populi TaxID=1505588 RepID=UPI002E176B95|nr:inovirus Gp2 family protein [Brenneria populi subsp. brevivirga]
MYALNHNHGPLNYNYLDKIIEVIDRAIAEHPRTFALRFDLHLPDIQQNDINGQYGIAGRNDAAVISRFIDSLKAHIRADITRRSRNARVHPCTMRYVWVREFNPLSTIIEKWHYHVLILLNKDTYAYPGNYQDNNNLASMIINAWASALRLNEGECKNLVHIPENPYYYLNSREPITFQENRGRLIYRISYIAKLKTKSTDDGYRSFGCSQR